MNILSSFIPKNELNSRIWTHPNNPKLSKMKKEVRQRLLEIGYEFQEYLDVDVVISDIQMTGSLTNYNWSEYSDVDLHLIVDFNQFTKNQLPLYEKLFKLKKTIFNLRHNIKIYGYDVELYTQDENEKRTEDSGSYSVLHDEWINLPKKEKITIDKKILMDKVDSWMEKIDNAIDDAEESKLDDSFKIINKLDDKIKEYRQSGLKKGGEYSYENLVFKYLRRNGYLEKLMTFNSKKMDKELSLRELRNNL